MSDEIIIKNMRPTILGLQGRLRLVPGKNTITLEQYEQNRNVDTFKSWQRLGWISVRMPKAPVDDRFPEPEEPEEADALEDLNVAQAKSLVKSTDSIEVLDAWYVKERRSTVQKVIKSRLADLTDDEDEVEE